MIRRRWAEMHLCAVLVVLAGNAAAGGVAPHPAVVRVMSAEQDGASFGSGVLVALNDIYGLVLTNWHVVRDCRGMVFVVFPDGFRSAARIMRTDRDWDLAALLIWRPNVMPVPLASEAPRPGEWLTIAGYGKGSYRASSGQCTQYVSPGRNLPFEIVEVATGAREGDSGGPIFNSRGELVGVLFGTEGGRTLGSYCARVRIFLDPVIWEFQRLPAPPNLLARHSTPAALSSRPTQPVSPQGHPAANPAPTAAIAAPIPTSAENTNQRPPQPNATQLCPTGPVEQVLPDGMSPAPASATPLDPAVSNRGPSLPHVAIPGVAPPVNVWERLKTTLAIVGVVLLVINGWRLLGRAIG